MGPSSGFDPRATSTELRRLVVERIQAILERDEAPPEGAGTWELLAVPLRAVGRVTRSYPGVLEYILTSGKDGPTTLSGSERTVQRARIEGVEEAALFGAGPTA